MIKKLFAWLIVVSASIFAVVGVSASVTHSAYADGKITEDQILKKALMNDLHTCYLGSDGTSYLRASFTIGPTGDFAGPKSLIVDDGRDKDGVVALPSGFTDIKDNDLSCAQLLTGYSGPGGSFPGIFTYGNGTVTSADLSSSTSSQATFLEQMGYESDGSGGAKQSCAQFSYSWTAYDGETDEIQIVDGRASTGNISIGTVCAAVDANGNIASDNTVSVEQTGPSQDDLHGNIEVPVIFSSGSQGNAIDIQDTVTSGTASIQCTKGMNFINDCISQVRQNLAGDIYNTITIGRIPGVTAYYQYHYMDSATSFTEHDAVASSFNIGTVTDSKFNTVADNIFGNHDREFSAAEAQSLYQAYLNKYATISCASIDSVVNELIGSGYNSRKVAVIVDNGEIKSNCYVKFNSTPQAGNNVTNGKDGFFVPSNGYWSQIVDENGLLSLLNPFSVDVSQRPSVIPVTVNDVTELCDPTKEDCDGDNAAPINGEDSCYGSGSKLGWILCPIISALQEFMDDLYENIVEPMLQINVSAFNTDSGVYQTWQTFQNIANVIFVIVFLFTIFSQITGFGIDNYGVKRLLPKLIIAAILVNLSFIICQTLVDISNIAGNGLKDLLMNTRVNGQAVSGAQSALANFINGAGMAGVGVGVVTAVATSAAWAPSLIPAFLLGLLAALIGILFMFILLGIRQAGVIILVVVSPVAILMYMLPNTKSIFDKWKNLFQALLVLYPVCGLMIGGCALAGKVIISSADNFWMALLGGLLSVIPFFLVPKITKGALSAMGKIGGMIAGAGQKIGGAAQSAAKFGLNRSRLSKNLQDRSQLHERERERKRLTGIVNRINRNPENMRTDKQKRQLAMAQSQLNRMTQEDAESEAGIKALDLGQATSTAVARRFNNEVEAIKLQNVNSGVAGKTGDISDTDFANGAQFADGTLAHALYTADSEEARYAAVNQLMASGHHGEQALHQVMQRLGEDGNSVALKSISKAAKGDRNFGGLKGASRSTYDYINSIANGDILNGPGVSEGEQINNRVGSQTKFSNMSQEGLVSTNKEELRRYLDAMRNGEIGATQAVALRNLATEALHNDRLAGKRKGDVETILKQIVNNAPYTDLKISHNSQKAGTEKLSTNTPMQPENSPLDTGALDRARGEDTIDANTTRQISGQSHLYDRIRDNNNSNNNNA